MDGHRDNEPDPLKAARQIPLSVLLGHRRSSVRSCARCWVWIAFSSICQSCLRTIHPRTRAWWRVGVAWDAPGGPPSSHGRHDLSGVPPPSSLPLCVPLSLAQGTLGNLTKKTLLAIKTVEIIPQIPQKVKNVALEGLLVHEWATL